MKTEVQESTSTIVNEMKAMEQRLKASSWHVHGSASSSCEMPIKDTSPEKLLAIKDTSSEELQAKITSETLVEGTSEELQAKITSETLVEDASEDESAKSEKHSEEENTESEDEASVKADEEEESVNDHESSVKADEEEECANDHEPNVEEENMEGEDEASVKADEEESANDHEPSVKADEEVIDKSATRARMRKELGPECWMYYHWDHSLNLSEADRLSMKQIEEEERLQRDLLLKPLESCFAQLNVDKYNPLAHVFKEDVDSKLLWKVQILVTSLEVALADLHNGHALRMDACLMISGMLGRHQYEAEKKRFHEGRLDWQKIEKKEACAIWNLVDLNAMD